MRDNFVGHCSVTSLPPLRATDFWQGCKIYTLRTDRILKKNSVCFLLCTNLNSRWMEDLNISLNGTLNLPEKRAESMVQLTCTGREMLNKTLVMLLAIDAFLIPSERLLHLHCRARQKQSVRKGKVAGQNL